MYENHVTIVDYSVYLPKSRIHVTKAIQQVKADGVEFRMSDSEYLNKGFELVSIEEELELEQMIATVCRPILRRALQMNVQIAAVMFASVTNNENGERNLFDRLADEFALEAVPFIPLEEYSCSTMHLSLCLASNYFMAPRQQGEGILFITADRAMNSYERSDPFMVFGDGASAALYMKGQCQGQQTLASVMRVDGLVYDLAPDRIQLYYSTFYLGVRQAVRAALSESGIHIAQIAVIFCTNLGLHVWSMLAQVLRVSLERFYNLTLSKDGHIHNTDILNNIDHAIRSGFLKEGDLYMTISVGFGGYYGCAIHRYAKKVNELCI
ncbi:3-oxoacyl-[acyl-carrier-protein] synthase III C-terminal domain-containing protein [Paenibacillus polymyxa]|uniref:3-oxoacyl-[acyl-carrier-protein] synthase III C-terminal domain-containing protein n=1 Tax=Paenibacillus polymyxa TaxID=1406 RepID=UPI0032AFC545